MIGSAFLAACVLVIPTQNVVVDHGRVFTYADQGDYIQYRVRGWVSPTVRQLVEHRKGTAVRISCKP